MEIHTLCSSWEYIFNKNPYDHEIEYDNNLKDTPKKLLMNIIPFGELLFFKKSIAYEVIKHALGIKTKVMIAMIENARPRAILISRIYVIIWISIITWLDINFILVTGIISFITSLLWKRFT